MRQRVYGFKFAEVEALRRCPSDREEWYVETRLQIAQRRRHPILMFPNRTNPFRF